MSLEDAALAMAQMLLLAAARRLQQNFAAGDFY